MFVDFSMSKKDFEVLYNRSEIDNLDMLAEECSELIQVISKYKRSKGIGFKTPITTDDAVMNLNEEIADVLSCIKYQMLLTKGVNLSYIEKVAEFKTDRFLERLEK